MGAFGLVSPAHPAQGHAFALMRHGIGRFNAKRFFERFQSFVQTLQTHLAKSDCIEEPRVLWRKSPRLLIREQRFRVAAVAFEAEGARAEKGGINQSAGERSFRKVTRALKIRAPDRKRDGTDRFRCGVRTKIMGL